MSTATLSAEETDRLVAYISWHALADEVVCNGVATGLRHAPTREARAMMLRQMREEYAHHTFMTKLVEDHGASLPDALGEATAKPAEAAMEFANANWVSFLVGFQVTMDGIYGYPWSKAVMGATIRDERYYRFYDTVLFPQEIGHYNFAQKTLHELVADDASVLDEVIDVARNAYPVYVDFIASSFPILAAVGCDTSEILPRMQQIRDTYWPKEFGVAIDESTATPDSDVEYGPGM